MKSVQTFT